MVDHLTSFDAERAVIGCVLNQPAAYDVAAELVEPEHFSSIDCAVVWRAIGSLIESGQRPDVLTLGEAMRDAGTLAQVGGVVFLSECSAVAHSVANTRRYAEVILRRAQLRDIRRICGGVLEETDDASADPSVVAAGIESGLQDVFDKDNGGPVEVGTGVMGVMEWIDQRAQTPGSLAGLSTGFHDLDRMTCGLQGGELIIIGARPAMGKTTFALNVASHMAKRYGPGIFFSLEMPLRQLLLRELSSSSGVQMQDMRSGELNRDDFERLGAAASSLSGVPLLVDERSGLTPHQIHSACRRVRRQRGLKFVVVDYIGLVRGDGENRNHQIGDVSRRLKALSKEMGIPVIALAQLNRALSARTDKRPGLPDLRDSGEVEQDADIVMFIHREEYYRSDDPTWRGIAEVIVAKQRNGPVGTVQLGFDAGSVRFTNLDKDAQVDRAALADTPPKTGRRTFDDA